MTLAAKNGRLSANHDLLSLSLSLNVKILIIK